MTLVDSFTNPHQAIEAEQAVIGAVFLDNGAMDVVAHVLESRDFTVLSHEIIWTAMKYQHKNEKPIDYPTIAHALDTYKRLEEVGGITYLMELTNSAFTSANVKYYAEIIKSNAYRRRGINAGIEISQLAEKDFESDEDYFQNIEKIALSIRPQSDGDMQSIADSRKAYFDHLEVKDDFIHTGFQKFDDWMGGIGRGWLYILAGRPSVGKTAKVLQMMKGIAESGAGDVLFWSQEMKRNQLLNRMLSPESGVNGNKIRMKDLTFHEKLKLNDAYDKLQELPIFIEDAKNVTIDEVRAYARQHKRTHKRKLGAIVVDYLTIMRIIQQKGETRSQAVGYVTRTAKQIALELDCPFIMLAQLSRDGKDEPKLEHLRDSGEIEQDADIVEFLWHNPEEKSAEGKVIQSIIAKGRDIGMNQFQYVFKGWLQKYEQL